MNHVNDAAMPRKLWKVWWVCDVELTPGCHGGKSTRSAYVERRRKPDHTREPRLSE